MVVVVCGRFLVVFGGFLFPPSTPHSPIIPYALTPYFTPPPPLLQTLRLNPILLHPPQWSVWCGTGDKPPSDHPLHHGGRNGGRDGGRNGGRNGEKGGGSSKTGRT